ncbi:MAG: hypothetical protein IIA90_07680 [Chloroflexi bacterium]|nr:hypothetical protein [Chloroflexota bacterium]
MTSILSTLPQPTAVEPYRGSGPATVEATAYSPGAGPQLRSVADRTEANRVRMARAKDEIGEYGEGAQRSVREQMALLGRTGSAWEGREMGRLSAAMLGEQGEAVRDVAELDLAAEEEVGQFNAIATNRYGELEASRRSAYDQYATGIDQYNVETRSRYDDQRSRWRGSELQRRQQAMSERLRLATSLSERGRGSMTTNMTRRF